MSAKVQAAPWTIAQERGCWSRPLGYGFESALICWQEKLRAMSQPAFAVVLPRTTLAQARTAWIRTSLAMPILRSTIRQDQKGDNLRLFFQPFGSVQEAQSWASSTFISVDPSSILDIPSSSTSSSTAVHKLWEHLASLPRRGIPNDPASCTSKLTLMDFNDTSTVLIFETHHTVCDISGLIETIKIFLSELKKKEEISNGDLGEAHSQAKLLCPHYMDALDIVNNAAYEHGQSNDALIQRVVSPSQGIPLKATFAGKASPWPETPSTCYHACLSKEVTSKLLQLFKKHKCSVTHAIGAAMQVSILTEFRHLPGQVEGESMSCAVPIVIDARRFSNNAPLLGNASEMSALFADTNTWDTELKQGHAATDTNVQQRCFWSFVEQFQTFLSQHLSSVDSVINKGLHDLWQGYGSMMAAMALGQAPSPPSTAMGCNSLGNLDNQNLEVQACYPLARTWGATTIPHVYTERGQFNVNINYLPVMFEEGAQERVVVGALQLLSRLVQEGDETVTILYNPQD